jgi:hypothetical protein
MTAHPYHKKLARVLDRMGGVFIVTDILDAIAAGKMQGFVEGGSWAVTQVVAFPRARVLEIVGVVGDIEECRRLHDRLIKYADDNDIAFIQAYGRRGWISDAAERGWKVKTVSYLYQREM